MKCDGDGVMVESLKALEGHNKEATFNALMPSNVSGASLCCVVSWQSCVEGAVAVARSQHFLTPSLSGAILSIHKDKPKVSV